MDENTKNKEASAGRSRELDGLGEFQLIRRLTRDLGAMGERVLVGVGDDAAILRPSGADLAVTCDAQVDGVHFRSDIFAPEEVGRRAAAVNLSDVAAMGGQARWAVVSLLVPPNTSAAWLERMYEGLIGQLGQFGCCLVGGNVSRTTGPLTVDMTVIGEVEAGRRLLRSGARTGDRVCVTGTLGDAAAGLHLGLSPDSGGALPREWVGSLSARYKTPVPRMKIGQLLAQTSAVSSCIDLSDGIGGDAGHVAHASGVRIQIEIDKLPLSPCLKGLASRLEQDPFEWALSGGDDFELLFTLEAGAFEELSREIAAQTGIAVTAVGRVVPGASGVEFLENGKPRKRHGGGYQHFSPEGAQ